MPFKFNPFTDKLDEIGAGGVTSPVNVPNGGTGLTSLTPYAILTGGTTATGNLQQVASLGTTGQVLTSNGAAALPSFKSITELPWTVIGASQTLAVNNGYFCTSGAALSLSLPAVSSVGDTIKVCLDGSTSWTITQPNAASRIRVGSSETSLGVGGTIASTAVGDTVTLVCETANARWVVTNIIGNISLS